MQFLPLVALVAVFYFLILRPQQKRAKEHKTLMEALQKGDEVATIGGILGKVTKVNDDSVTIEIADNVIVQVQKAAIQNVLPKGTIKSN
jgi:preprotein translocase subunit YajC